MGFRVALSVQWRHDGLADNGIGVRWPRRETNDSHQSTDEVRSVWCYTSIPYTSSWRVVLSNRIHFYLCLVFATFVHQQPTCATRLGTGRPGARIPGGARNFCLLHRSPDRLWDPPSLLLQGNPCSFPEVKRQGRKVTHLYKVSRLWMSGALSPPPLYVFMACTGKTLL